MRLTETLRLIAAVVAVAAAMLMLPGLRATYGEAPEEPPRQSMMSIGEDLVLTEPVDRDVEVLGGSVRIETTVDGDVVVLAGKVELGESAQVTGDLVTFGGTVSGADASNIKGKIIQPLWRGDALATLTHGGLFDSLDRRFSVLMLAFKVSLLLVWLAAAIVITLSGSREIRSSSLELRANPFHTLLVGLVAFTSFILTAIVFSYLIPYFVGIPLLVALGVFAIVTKVYGMIAVFHLVGSLLFRPSKREELQKRRWLRGDLALVVFGLVILGLIRLVPVVGGFVWMLASLMGVGSALATKFGRREPWFLAWQSAEGS